MSDLLAPLCPAGLRISMIVGSFLWFCNAKRNRNSRDQSCPSPKLRSPSHLQMGSLINSRRQTLFPWSLQARA